MRQISVEAQKTTSADLRVKLADNPHLFAKLNYLAQQYKRQPFQKILE
jgi:hypothetical protein